MVLVVAVEVVIRVCVCASHVGASVRMNIHADCASFVFTNCDAILL